VATTGSESLYEWAGLLSWTRILFTLVSLFGLWEIYQQKKRGAYLFLGSQVVLALLPLLVLGADKHYLYYVGLTGASSMFMALIFLWASRSFHANASSQTVGPVN
jgi:hypothetical protein